MNRMIFILSATALTLLMHDSISLAGEGDETIAKVQVELEARFHKADANHDGLLTRDEAKGTMPRVFSHFDEIDAAHKGALSLDDIESFLMSKMQERQKQVVQK